MKNQLKALARSVKYLATGSVCTLVLAAPALAGKIISDQETPPGTGGSDSGVAYGFGGWNLDNVEVYLNPEIEPNTAFNTESGWYSFPVGSDHTYYADLFNGNEGDSGRVLIARVLAKDWPIGEPAGIKVINDDPDVRNGRPANCIMATSYLEGAYLDSADPSPVLCSGPYQSHKRFKVAMLPDILDGNSVDMVFNVEDDATRQYEVFQKINNWTGRRLTGFTIEVGFGVGENFTPVEGAAAENLKLSVPDDLFDEDSVANFSAGLFGPLDPHGQVGFFDDKTRAGFFIDEYGTDAGNLGTDSLHATRRLGSNYEELPRGVEAMNQFGYWLPNNALPWGIFFDDDGNPDTDAVLVAWYGYNPATEALGWMGGVADKFAAVDDSVVEGYANSLLYSADVIDDLVNVGLNYIVTVGDVSTYPEGVDTFTIRITPSAVAADSPDAAFPPYVTYASGHWEQVPPTPWLAYSAPASVMLQPGPVFEIGDVLTARVGDASANSDPDAIDEVTVSILTDGGNPESVTLYELGEDRGVFAANLPTAYSESSAGTVITLDYKGLTDSTTAVTPQEPPVSYELSVTSLEVPESIADGLTRKIRVRVQNEHQTEASAAGFVRLTGVASDGTLYDTFADVPFTLDPGKQLFATFLWTASLADPAVAQTVDWTAGVYAEEPDVDPILIDSAAAVSEVTPKLPKKGQK